MTRIAQLARIGGLALVLAVALVPAASAAKGGGGDKPGGGGSGPALTGSVDPARGMFTVHGTGFRPGEIVSLGLAEAGGCCSALNMVADNAGSFTTTQQLMGPGAYTVYASELISRRWRVVAQWSFHV